MLVGKVSTVARGLRDDGGVLMCLQLPFGLDPRQQRLEELIARTDSVPADFDLYGVVDTDVRDLLTKVRPTYGVRRNWLHIVGVDVGEGSKEEIVDSQVEEA